MAMVAGVLPMASGKPSASVTNPVKRKADVLEMLSYVHSLGIDHVRESEMLWIAEEAYHAPLPPGWTEHVDDSGRTYFYNMNIRESLWQHPLDEVFVEIANYWRRVIKAGGFWDVDEELAEIEERIRQDLSDWMELYDEQGNKFYFNRSTEESCFDDPRHSTYHSLYTRIRLVNMMKEKLPLLAIAPRPSEPIVNQARLLKEKKEAEEKVARAVMRVQAAVRVMQARRRARILASKRCLNRVPTELQGMLKLHVRTSIPGTHHKEVVLAVTQEHKKNRAATKIQARIRGYLVRRRVRPMLEHKRYMNRHAVVIQRHVKVMLESKNERQEAKMIKLWAALRLQCWARMMAARRLYHKKLAEMREFEAMIKAVVVLQTRTRRVLAKKRVDKIRLATYTPAALCIQSQIKGCGVRNAVMEAWKQSEPVQCLFTLTSGEKAKTLLPFYWKLVLLPVGDDGRVVKEEDVKARNEERKIRNASMKKSILKVENAPEPEPMEEVPNTIDLFVKVGMASLEDAAATQIQRGLKSAYGKQKFMRAVYSAKNFSNMVIDAAADEVVSRQAAALPIQTIFRGWRIRRLNLIQEKYKAWLSTKDAPIVNIQNFILKFNSQKELRDWSRFCLHTDSVTAIQRRWRGVMARQHAKHLAEEAEWPLKGWFEYNAVGRDSVQMSIKFIPNPGFDAYRHFRKHGKEETLLSRLHDMQAEIDGCLRLYLGPEEFAALEAERAAQEAARQAVIDSEKEAKEAQAMHVAEIETWVIEEVVRAQEAEARHVAEEEAAEAARLAEEQAQDLATVADALANFSGLAATIEASEAAGGEEDAGDKVVGGEGIEEGNEGSKVDEDADETQAEQQEGAEDLEVLEAADASKMQADAIEDPTATAEPAEEDVEADVTVLAEGNGEDVGEEAAQQMDLTAPAAALPDVEVAATEAGAEDPSSLSAAPPERGSTMDSGSAYQVLSQAAEEMRQPRESPGHSVSGSHRSRGSGRSKASKHSQDPMGYPPPPPVDPALQEPSVPPPPPRGALRYDIRPGLVDMAALNKVMRDNASVRDRRNNLADQRRAKHPIESQLSYMAQPQRMLHRHVHHHVHYHGNEDEGGMPSFQFGGASTALPGGIAPGQLEPLRKERSSSKGSKNSKRSNGSRSSADLKLKALQPAGPAGPAFRKPSRSATESSLDNSGLMQGKLQPLGNSDGMETPRRRQEA
eukprot:CAMPEP_0197632896 /NCGR_PEP_ID=MMETSP1338-20131121/9424_1 /TAXON_ID=43686 ORGANISM="Pelagodinium beii, Strain RCC1491" /NCGR_SAMPLE_ID=MMETSP1338 /ASSEMBLY_ACC=CAM_ASM_000754 /LENGTH=1198 /DNA_ID=CAMNT_0043204473 /DNA_START=88 /DNA_END=3684 /DNA_ORIENTATION=+